MKRISLFVMASLAFLSVSCSDDSASSNPSGDYDDGVLVLNEGNAVSGSVTYLSEDGTTVEQGIFAAVNPTETLGGYLQSVFFDGNRAYIISNGSNKITVVNRYTFTYIGTIEGGLSVPRYGVADGGKAYVTNLGSFTDETDDFVAVINLDTQTIETTWPIGNLADHIEKVGQKLFIANGSFGAGHSVTVLNATTGASLGVIETELSPNSMAYDDGKLYVLCGAFATDGLLHTIDPGSLEVTESKPFTGYADPQYLAVDEGDVYFCSGTSFCRMRRTPQPPQPEIESFATEAMTLYGFTVHDGKAYVADARDFASNGIISIYDIGNGSLIANAPAGIAPNGFYFND